MFTWEHRLVRIDDNSSDPIIYFAEVSFNKDGKPYGYNEPFMCSETVEGLSKLLKQLKVALGKPVLDYNTDFVHEPAVMPDTSRKWWKDDDDPSGFDGPNAAE